MLREGSGVEVSGSVQNCSEVLCRGVLAAREKAKQQRLKAPNMNVHGQWQLQRGTLYYAML